MEYINSIVFGIIQGLTEFWPVSSSGHLVIAHEFLNFNFVDDLGFDVALHLGTLVAVVAFFWKEISTYIVAFFKSFANWNLQHDTNQRLAWYIAIGTLPAVCAGYLVADYADSIFRNLWLVASLLVGVGIVLIVAEKIFQQKNDLSNLSWKGALTVAFSQILALVPGVSRSGITIIAGLSQGLHRAAATRFSFLLSVPIIAGAGFKKIVDVAQQGLGSEQWMVMASGFLSAAVVGYIAISFLLRFVEHRSLNVFGYYRIGLGILVMLYLVLR